MSRAVWAAAAIAVWLMVLPDVAGAQETRAAILERQRAEKQTNLQPYKPGKLEKWMLWFEDVDPKSKIAPHNGFFVL